MNDPSINTAPKPVETDTKGETYSVRHCGVVNGRGKTGRTTPTVPTGQAAPISTQVAAAGTGH